MNKLKGSILIGLFSLIVSSNLLAEERKTYMFKYKGAGDSGKIELDNDEEFEIGFITNTSDKFIIIRFYVEDVIADEWVRLGNNSYNRNLRTIVGPIKFDLRTSGMNNEGQFIYLTTTKKKQESYQSKNVTGYSLVLPESKDNSYNLVLESSTDLVNWTSDKTGSKGPSEKKRFYRLRAVKE